MKQIEYRVTFAEGQSEIIEVTTRDINSGFRAVLPAAKRYNPFTGKLEELSRIEFWQVKT